MCKRGYQALVLGCIGGAVYMAVELLWRGHTHWSMGVLGGLCFVAIGLLNERLSWSLPLLIQALAGAAMVTVAELVAGVILNLWLDLHIWDYSSLPFNLWGQICLWYSLLWIPLSVAAVLLDDWLRYWLWGEEKPHYTLF